MKTTKIVTIATIATILLIALCGIATATAENYKLIAMVKGWERIGETELYTITVIDEDGNTWDFLGSAEDAHIGNLYTLIMKDQQAQHDEADEIIDTVYLTHLTQYEVMNFLRSVKW